MHDIDEAKTHLSRLIERAEAGEEVVIARAGKPVARLVAYKERKGPRRPGVWRGKVRMAPDFDELPDEIIEALGGTPDEAPSS